MAEKIWIVPTRQIPMTHPHDGSPVLDAEGKPKFWGPILREVIDAREACKARPNEKGEVGEPDWAFAPGTAQALTEPDEVADEAAAVARAAKERRAQKADAKKAAKPE